MTMSSTFHGVFLIFRWVYLEEASSWQDARAKCLLEGGDLVSPSSLSEHLALTEFINLNQDDISSVWIGGQSIGASVS